MVKVQKRHFAVLQTQECLVKEGHGLSWMVPKMVLEMIYPAVLEEFCFGNFLVIIVQLPVVTVYTELLPLFWCLFV